MQWEARSVEMGQMPSRRDLLLVVEEHVHQSHRTGHVIFASLKKDTT
jgi:hypothetical protein